MNKTALDPPNGNYFQLSSEMIESGLKASRNSNRKRMILPIHRRQDAQVQRMINFLQPGTYIRPHKHPMPHASESIVVVQGSIRFITFDEKGAVLTSDELHALPIPDVIDIEPQTWHSFIVLGSDTIIFECKKGPYDTKTDKKFAEWAPAEGDAEAINYLKKLAQ